MSENSYIGEDEDVNIFGEIPEDSEELSIESPASPPEFEDDNGEQFEEAFKAEANNKKLGKSSKDSEEKQLEQKSQSSSRAESRKNSIQSLQDEIRSLRISLENDEAKPFQLPSKKSSTHSEISAESEALSKSDEGVENETTDSRKSSQKSIKLLDGSSKSSKDKMKKWKSPQNAGKKTLAADKKDLAFLGKSRADRMSVGQVTLMSYANSSAIRRFLSRREIPNTYQLESKRPFLKTEAMAIVDSVLATYLEDFTDYEVNSARNVAKNIASDVRTRLVRCLFDR